MAGVFLAGLAGAQTMGVNHYGFGDGDLKSLRQLSPSPVPLRMTFYWHAVAAAPNYYDPQVAAATQAGVPILGVLGYSSKDESSMPVDFDFTEISPFNISWHTDLGPLPWGSDGIQGTAKYIWNARLEDGRTYHRVVEVKPTAEGAFVHGVVTFAVPKAHSVVLWAKVGFRHGSDTQTRANFSVTYLKEQCFPSLASIEKKYDGALSTLTADLTSLGGTTIKLFFNLNPVEGYSTGDAVWQAAGILVDGAPLSMAQVVGDDLQSVINYPPHDPDAFAAYAANLARRYPQIQAWEVWNEPNISFFWRPTVDAEAYTTLLKKTYGAVKSANPNAKVLLGGLSPGTGDGQLDAVPATNFLARVYQNGGGAFFDAVAYHAYGVGGLEDWLPYAIGEIRGVMEAYADTAKPVWITEMGCYTSGLGSTSEEWQAEILRQARSILPHFPYVDRVYWYTLRDAGGSADPEKRYGLFRADGSPKPAVLAFASPIGN